MPIQQKSVGFIFLLGFVAFNCTNASADFVVFSDRNSWTNAVANATTINFEDFGVTAEVNDPSAVAFPGSAQAESISRFGVTFSGRYLTPDTQQTISEVNVFGPNYQGYQNAGSAYLVLPRPGSTAIVSLGAGQTAIGLDVGILLPGPADLVIDLGAQGSHTVSRDATFDFIGFILDSPISALEIQQNGANYIGIDNFSFDNPSAAFAVPLPPSGILALVGLLGTPLLLRRYGMTNVPPPV